MSYSNSNAGYTRHAASKITIVITEILFIPMLLAKNKTSMFL